MPDEILKSVFPRLYAILPSTGQADVTLSADDSPVERRFAGDLVILYGRDLGTHYTLVAKRELRQWGCTTEQLHAAAIANLNNVDKEIRLHKGAPISMITCDGNLEASFLLHEGIWDYISEQVEGEVIASVPARDLLLVCRKEKAAISELKKKASYCIEHVDKPLSSRLFSKTDNVWQEYPM